jgi:hypothetical protein
MRDRSGTPMPQDQARRTHKKRRGDNACEHFRTVCLSPTAKVKESLNDVHAYTSRCVR